MFFNWKYEHKNIIFYYKSDFLISKTSYQKILSHINNFSLHIRNYYCFDLLIYGLSDIKISIVLFFLIRNMEFMFYMRFYSRFDTWFTRSLCFTCVSMLFWHVIFTEFMFNMRFYSVLTIGFHGVYVLHVFIFSFDTWFTWSLCFTCVSIPFWQVVYTEFMFYMRFYSVLTSGFHGIYFLHVLQVFLFRFDTWFTRSLCFTCVSIPIWHVVYTGFRFYMRFYSRFDTWFTRNLFFTCVSIPILHVVYTGFMFYMRFYSRFDKWLTLS